MELSAVRRSRERKKWKQSSCCWKMLSTKANSSEYITRRCEDDDERSTKKTFTFMSMQQFREIANCKQRIPSGTRCELCNRAKHRPTNESQIDFDGFARLDRNFWQIDGWRIFLFCFHRKLYVTTWSSHTSQEAGKRISVVWFKGISLFASLLTPDLNLSMELGSSNKTNCWTFAPSEPRSRTPITPHN